jgi:hypothetical protein
MIARAAGVHSASDAKTENDGGETLSFDYTFHIPVEVTAAVFKYRHNRWKFEWGNGTPGLQRFDRTRGSPKIRSWVCWSPRPDPFAWFLAGLRRRTWRRLDPSSSPSASLVPAACSLREDVGYSAQY